MKRRSAIRSLVIIAGGITLFPSCLGEQEKVSGDARVDITGDDEALLAEIVGTIIPKTDSPGAKELNVHLFVLKMLKDCYEQDVQQNFIKGLRSLETAIKKQYGHSFAECTAAQRQKILLKIENNEGESPEEVYGFYDLTKKKTIQGYLSSKYVMTNIIPYEFVPSHEYNGYVQV